MVAYVLDEHLRHVRTIRLWRGEFGTRPPFDTGPDTLVVAYAAWAELTCFQVLGWPFPAHVFDLHAAYLATSNILLPYNPDETRNKPRKGLSDACCAYGIDGWEAIDKPTVARDIGEGRWQKYGKDGVFELLRGGRGGLDEAAASASARPRRPTACRRGARAALVQVFRPGDRANPGPRHAH